MNYLITAAGIGSRFLNEGIKPSKPLIKVHGIELILWSLNSFKFNSNDNLYIVTLKSDKVKLRVLKKINFLYPNINIFWLEIDEILNGQLLTALEAVNFFKIKGELLIHNCDTSYDFDYSLFKSLLRNDPFGIIPFFNSEGENWSFIKLQNDLVVEVKEKERISNNCSLGTYFFKSAEFFYDLANDYLDKNNIHLNKEFFIAPLYEYAISKSLNIYAMKSKNVKIFGTVSELLNAFEISFYELLSENDFNGHQRKTLVVDIDGTLCKKPIMGDYSECIPINDICEKLRYHNSMGAYIILYTSRNMRSFKGNIGLINKHTSYVLINWLKKYDIPFDELYFGKPWGRDLSYIDDKSLSINNFLNLN